MKSNPGHRPLLEVTHYAIAVDALAAAKEAEEPFAVAQATCTTHVFAAMTLEAFINAQYSDSHETMKLLDVTERLPLKIKWLMLPLLLGCDSTFDQGQQPFVGFTELVRLRNNRLVHFKPHREARLHGRPYESSDLLTVLADVQAAADSIDAVSAMITELHRLTGGRTGIPDFLSGARPLKLAWGATTGSSGSRGTASGRKVEEPERA